MWGGVTDKGREAEREEESELQGMSTAGTQQIACLKRPGRLLRCLNGGLLQATTDGGAGLTEMCSLLLYAGLCYLCLVTRTI